MPARAPSWFMGRETVKFSSKGALSVYGVTPQLDHHLALQKHLLLWSLCPPGGLFEVSTCRGPQLLKFASPGPSPDVPLCLLVGHLVWRPSYDLLEQEETKLSCHFLQLVLPGSIILSVVNKLSFSPQVGLRFVYARSFILCNHHLFEGFCSAPKFSCVSF